MKKNEKVKVGQRKFKNLPKHSDLDKWVILIAWQGKVPKIADGVHLDFPYAMKHKWKPEDEERAERNENIKLKVV